MREFESWKDEDLLREYVCSQEAAARWHGHAVRAANDGVLGMLYFNKFEDKASKFRSLAGRIAHELKAFRGHQTLPEIKFEDSSNQE